MFVGNSLSACAVAFTKLSIISSYLRVFPHQSLRVTMFVTMAITIGLMLASIPVTVFQCDPVRAAWDFTITDGRVSDIQVFDYLTILPSRPTCFFLMAYWGPETSAVPTWSIFHRRTILMTSLNSATISSTSSTLALRSAHLLTSYCALYLFGFYGPSRSRKSRKLLFPSYSL